jgi:2-phospho-L-lactate/phosphoenolpyruvate guanylyltransferase
MTLWAIVPVKPLKRGKSRLSSVLSVSEREALNQSMLVNTLKTLKQIKEIDTVLVVSRDPSALAIAREYNARTVLEDGSPELNMALQRASMVAKAYYVNEILVLPADLPLIKPENIREILSLISIPPEIIIAPDCRKDGTNALYINPADLISFHYGPGSYEQHVKNAKSAGAKIQIIENEILGLDLDLPEDLLKLEELEEKQRNKSVA